MFVWQAVEIVTNTTLALGSKVLNDEGAIVSRLSSIEDMASMSILCSDKVLSVLYELIHQVDPSLTMIRVCPADWHADHQSHDDSE